MLSNLLCLKYPCVSIGLFIGCTSGQATGSRKSANNSSFLFESVAVKLSSDPHCPFHDYDTVVRTQK